MSVFWLCIFLIFCNYTHGRTVVKEEEIIKNFKDDEEKTPFTLEEFFTSNFSASSFNGTWLTDSTFYYKQKDGNFYKFDVIKKSSELFLNGSILDDYPGASISISPDNTYALIRYNVSSVFRHSTTAVYAVYDITTRDYYDINDKNPVQLATFDTTGHGFAYVYENNIYYLSNVIDATPLQITSDGKPGIIYNGVPDWVYEEEVLGSGSALWFSPDGNNLAYVKFNDSNVKNFTYFIYGNPGELEDQYPTVATIRYPKVGTNNPVVSTYVFDLQTQTTTKFNLIDSIQDSEDNNDYVLYDLTWVSSSEVAMISTNRVQNESVIIRCTLDGSCREEVSYRQENGWLSPAIPKYNRDGTKRLEILPQAHEEDFFYHLVLTDITTNTPQRLTYGNRVVTYIYGWDEVKNLIYYAGSVNDTPSQQQIYVVNAETTENQCLTCGFEVDGGEKCKYAAASFSENFTHYVKVCSGPNPAYVVVQSLQNETDSFIWNENLEVREQLTKKLRHVPLDLRVPVANNFTARVRLLLPPDLDKNKKYPAIVNVYAGPNSNQINDAYSAGVFNYFVTNRNYIYIFIDGRGSGRDGLNKMFQMYRKMGTVEIEDQIAVTKYLQKNYPYIDRNNTGIWGWSYGGFASTWAVVQDTENIFKFALSVAPVTSFIYYDTIYTERYMGLPTDEDNILGYNNTDITRRVEVIRGKHYFVIHGNGDDNVHYQQTMLLVKALEAADISFRQQSYPDENHSIGGRTRHLYHTIDKYWARVFGVEGPPLTTW